MIIGQYYSSNQRKFSEVRESEWKVVLKKCEKHIRIRLKQKMSSGVHTAANLGTNPVEHYLEAAYTKLLA
ncbi:MAG TPA: hypothetical protein VNY73_00490, partial [Bacteroidia bacterium]|nr:hypothetical protein [Bacteroidia bacterium]